MVTPRDSPGALPEYLGLLARLECQACWTLGPECCPAPGGDPGVGNQGAHRHLGEA